MLMKMLKDRPDIAERAEFKFPTAGKGQKLSGQIDASIDRPIIVELGPVLTGDNPSAAQLPSREASFENKFNEFMGSIKGLRDTVDSDLPQVKDIAETDTKKALILFSDCILRQGPILDLEDTIKKAAILNGGTIIIYGSKAGEAAILEKIIKRANNSIDVMWISTSEVATRFNRADANEIDELRGLIDCAKSKPELSGKTLIGVVKGPATAFYEAAVRGFLSERKVAVVSFRSDYGMYSTYAALAAILEAQKRDNGKHIYWTIELAPITTWSIDKLDKDYFRKLEELETKA
jgi:hypothetical protein